MPECSLLLTWSAFWNLQSTKYTSQPLKIWLFLSRSSVPVCRACASDASRRRPVRHSWSSAKSSTRPTRIPTGNRCPSAKRYRQTARCVPTKLTLRSRTTNDRIASNSATPNRRHSNCSATSARSVASIWVRADRARCPSSGIQIERATPSASRAPVWLRTNAKCRRSRVRVVVRSECPMCASMCANPSFAIKWRRQRFRFTIASSELWRSCRRTSAIVTLTSSHRASRPNGKTYWRWPIDRRFSSRGYRTLYV